jgi:hypothetical protein
MSAEIPEWLVWSNEHHAWWGPNAAGYYKDARGAGIHTKAEAEECCERRSKEEGKPPPEVMVHIKFMEVTEIVVLRRENAESKGQLEQVRATLESLRWFPNHRQGEDWTALPTVIYEGLLADQKKFEAFRKFINPYS